jgi:hypothetical protein
MKALCGCGRTATPMQSDHDFFILALFVSNVQYILYRYNCLTAVNLTEIKIKEELCHGLINYKDTKTNYRLLWGLIEFID